MTTNSIDAVALALFVPADRPDRFVKALAAGADAVIIDLEDAVAPDRKDEARAMLADARESLAGAAALAIVRINAAGTPWHAEDLAAAAALPLAAIVLPKAESGADTARTADAAGVPVMALVESVRGIAAVRDTAGAAARLAFGSIDFAADLGCAHTRDALLGARFEVATASRLAGLPGPLDGVTATYGDALAIEDDARYAASLGFAGKLLIHPAQIAPARRGFLPTAEERAWAERILAAGRDGGAVAVDGTMVDAPVRLRAQSILRRASA